MPDVFPALSICDGVAWMEWLDWYMYPLIALSGVVCGILNTVAGGGSLITLPVLMQFMPDNEANVTNRLGFLFQSVVASTQFKKKKTFEWSWGLRPAIPLMLGTIIGAVIAVYVETGVVRQATAILLVVMLPFIFLQPEKWLRRKVTTMPKTKWWLYPVYFALGIYAGFLQAGIGYFLLIVLVLGTGYDLLTANSLKVFAVLFISMASLSVFFVFADKIRIHFDVGIAQALGQALGAYIGVKFAIAWKPQMIRWLLIALLLTFAAKLLLF